MNTLAPAENPQNEQVTENNSLNIESPNNIVIDSSENPSGIKKQSDGSIPIAIPQSTNLSKIEEEENLASSPKLSAAQCQKADSIELTGKTSLILDSVR